MAGSLALTPSRLRAFMKYVAKPSGIASCWIWEGALNGEGYPMFGSVSAYRVSYEWLVGPIPDKFDLDHLCRNGRCVNPHHVEPVTHAENVRRGVVARTVALNGGAWTFTPIRYCKQGHALIAGNTYSWVKDGKQQVVCATCNRDNRVRRHAG